MKYNCFLCKGKGFLLFSKPTNKSKDKRDGEIFLFDCQLCCGKGKIEYKIKDDRIDNETKIDFDKELLE